MPKLTKKWRRRGSDDEIAELVEGVASVSVSVGGNGDRPPPPQPVRGLKNLGNFSGGQDKDQVKPGQKDQIMQPDPTTAQEDQEDQSS